MVKATRPLYIDLYSGSRAWDADERSARWATRVVALALSGRILGVPDVVPPADIVIHGDAPGLDRFVDRVADAMMLPRVVFPVGVPGALVRDRGHGMRGTVVRAMRDAADFMYAAADPIAIGIIAPWSTSKGTRRTLDFAAEAHLDTYEISGDLIPPDAWPVEDAGPHVG